jgi:hypothetical protein
MPLVWLAFSILYLLFALSIEPRRMPADREGWDPGAAAMPIGIGVVMTAVSLYLVVTDRAPRRSRGEGSEQSSAEQSGLEPTAPAKAKDSAVSATPAGLDAPTAAIGILAALTTGSAFAYIVFFRILGFVAATALLLVTLSYFYSRRRIVPGDLPEFLAAAVASVTASGALFLAGRWAIRWAAYFGRTGQVELLSNRLVTAVLAIAIWGVVLVPLHRCAGRRVSSLHPGAYRSTVVAVLTTLGFWLVFQHIFRVALPAGVLS